LRKGALGGNLWLVDDEAVNLTLGLLADIAVNTKRIATLLEDDDGEEEEED
jgi:hypothetical protein